MRINEVEKLLEIPKATVRYYEDEGLVSPSRAGNGYRDYSDEDIDRIKSIIVLRKIGVSIPDIRSLFDGTAELDDVLRDTMSRLEQERSELTSALQVCGEIVSGNETMDTFDAGSLYDRIRNMESSGSKFVSLAREYASYEADHLRDQGFLPKNPHAPAHRKIGRFALRLLIPTIITIVIILLITGFSLSNLVSAGTGYLVGFVFVPVIASVVLFAIRKTRGPEMEASVRAKLKVTEIISCVVCVALLLFLAAFTGFFSRPEVTDDISRYSELRSGPNAIEKYRTRWDMDESIWPAAITDGIGVTDSTGLTDGMDVQDYRMVYYDPWDAQYLGYLVVRFSDENYERELERLRECGQSKYIGYYGVTEEKTHELLAINADPYYGFIYALSPGDNTIVYVEQVFCNYFMDLDYTKYIPVDYLLDGFDASEGNPYSREMLKDPE